MNLARMASPTRKTTPTSGPSAGPPNTLAVPSSPKSSCHGRSAFVCGVRYPQVFGERWLTPFPETPTLSIRASESPLGDAPLNIPKQALVVVGDGEKALFLRNVGTVRKLELEVENVLAHGNPSTHEQGTDKPGRTSAAWALRAARWKRAIRISWAKSGSPARSQPYFIGLPTPKSFSWNESHRLQARSPPVGYCDTPGRRRPPFRRRSRYVATDAIRCGQSASTATAVNFFSSINRCGTCARYC